MPDISDNQLADRLQLVGSWLLKQRGQGALHPGTIMDAPLLAEVFRGAIFWDEGANGVEDILVFVRKNDEDELEFSTIPMHAVGDPPTVTDFTNMQHPHTSEATGGLLPSLAISTALGFLPQKVFNAKDPQYGVVADGVTDDRTALNNLIATAFTAGGGIVYFPAGTYFISAQLTLRTGVYLQGAGMGLSIIKLSADVASNVLNGPTGVTYFGASHLTLDQNYGGGVTSGSGINIINCGQFIFDSVEVKNTSNNGILIDSGSHDGSVVNCYVHEIGKVGTSAGHGICTSGGANGGVYRVTITGNRVHNHEASGINLSDAWHCTATGNSVYRDASDADGYGGIRITNNASFNSVTGNTVYRPTRGLFIATTAGIGNVLSGNTVVESASQGCLVEVSHQSVTGNMFYNCATGGGTGSLQISDSTYVVVNGNTFIDDRTPKLTTHAIIESGASDFNEIGPNVIDGYLTGDMSLVGASTNVYRGGLTKTLSLTGKASVETVFNSSALNSDFRVSGDTRANLFVVDANPDGVHISAASGSVGQTASFTATGIIFNAQAADVDTRVSGDTDTNLLYVDAGTDRVGIGIAANTHASKLDVNGDIAITDGMTAPDATSGRAKIYVDAADGDLKVIFGDGTIKTLATDT